MTISGILACIPASYYYRTRYPRTFERILHGLKYWGTFGVLLLLLGDLSILNRLPALVLAWFGFHGIYDLFSLENDRMSVRFEAVPTIRDWDPPLPFPVFVGCRLFAATAAAALVWLLPGTAGTGAFAALLCVTAACFAAHNRVHEPFRPLTRYILYVLKGGLFFTVTADLLAGRARTLYALFVLLFSLTYMPACVARKVARKTREKLSCRTLGHIRFTLLQPIFYKNLVLVVLGLFCDSRFLVLLLWVDLMTAIELALRRRPPGTAGRVGSAHRTAP